MIGHFGLEWWVSLLTAHRYTDRARLLLTAQAADPAVE